MSLRFSKPRIPTYPKKAHASGQARVRASGRDYYLGVWGSEESKREYSRLIAELSSSRLQLSSNRKRQVAITVSGVLSRHLVHARTFYAKSSREPVCFRQLAIVVDRVCGSLPAASFDCAALNSLRTAMMAGSWLTEEEIEARKKRKQPIGWCRRVVNRMVTRLRTVWRWAETNGLVAPGAWSHLRALPPVPKHDANARNTRRRRPATWEQVSGILDELPPIVAAMLEVQWWTGMRPSEVVKMRAGQIEQGRGNGLWHYRLTEHKNDWREGRDDDELVVLGPECQRVLLPLIGAARNRGAAGYLFPPSRVRLNKCYTTAAYGRAIARACEAVGVEHFTPYQIRHAAKERIKRAAGLDAARAVLRQKSIQATDGYGDAIDMELASQVARKIG